MSTLITPVILAAIALFVAKNSKGLVMYVAYIAALILLGVAISAMLSTGLFYIVVALVAIGTVIMVKKSLQKSKR
jgi:predicted membrane protein